MSISISISISNGQDKSRHQNETNMEESQTSVRRRGEQKGGEGGRIYLDGPSDVQVAHVDPCRDMLACLVAELKLQHKPVLERIDSSRKGTVYRVYGDI
jgi:hypothetical protein